MSVQSIFQTLYSFFPTSRPKSWVMILGFFVLGILAAQPSPTSIPEIFNSLGRSHLWLFLYFSFPAHLLFHGINDIFTKPSQISPDQQKSLWVSIILVNIPFLLLSILPNPHSYLWLFIFCISAVLYSVPPIAAKSKPILDTIVWSFAILSPGLVGYYISWGTAINWMIGWAVLAWGMAHYAYNLLSNTDWETENTLSLYGKKGTLIFCIFCYALAVILSFPTMGWFAVGFGIIYILCMIFFFRSDVFRIYKYFPWVNLLMGGLVFLSVLGLKLNIF